MRFFDMRQKEVINIKDGCRMGFVSDVELDKVTGGVKQIIIPGPARILGVFGREQEYRVDWAAVKQIGDDIILVECDTDKALTDGEDM
jgi:YlmC/YmxH family sporulation protein